MHAAARTSNLLITSWTTPFDAGQQQLLELTTAMATFLLWSNVESATRAWQRTDLVSRFARDSVTCCLHAEEASRNAKRAALRAVHSRMHLYGHPCLYTRYCYRGPSKLVDERILGLRKIIVWKVFLVQQKVYWLCGCTTLAIDSVKVHANNFDSNSALWGNLFCKDNCIFLRSVIRETISLTT